MADKIIGTAVLQGDYLHFVYARISDGHCDFTHIPVVPKGREHPQDQPYWDYEENGDTLHVTPSVRMFTTDKKGNEHEIFHNEGQWDVKFIRLPEPAPKINPEVWPKLHEMNDVLMGRWRAGERF